MKRNIFYSIITIVAIFYMHSRGFNIEDGYTYSDIREAASLIVLFLILPIYLIEKMIRKKIVGAVINRPGTNSSIRFKNKR